MAELLFSVMKTIGSGLSAQRRKMESVASNIANAETTRTAEGGPYRRKGVVIRETSESRKFEVAGPGPSLPLDVTSPRHIRTVGLRSTTSVVKEEPMMEAQVAEAPQDQVKMVYDPHHPDANEEGYVAYPDVNPVEEMVDMITASRAYEANIAAMEAYKSIVEKALEI